MGGVDPDDTADPVAFRAALDVAGFVVALELRETDVTRAADVVFPVAPVVDKPGTFVNWEGRPREFPAVFVNPHALPDARVLAGIAEELGTPLGFRTSAEAHDRMVEMGPWDGDRATLPDAPPVARTRGDGEMALATWKLMLDNGTMQDGEKYLRATARTPVCRVSPAAADALGPMVTLTGDRGSVTLPVEATADLVDGTVVGAHQLHRQRRPRRPGLAGVRRTPEGSRAVSLFLLPVVAPSAGAAGLEQFGHDPWWLVLIKALLIFVILVLLTLFNIWFERRVVARMQHRIGPNVNGPFGLLQSLADGVKLALKEDIIPKAADKWVFLLAPVIAIGPRVRDLLGDPVRPRRQGAVHRPLHAAAADRHAGGGAVRDGGRLDRHLRHRARRLVQRVDVLPARRAALQRPDDLLRGRDGPRPGRGLPLRRLDVDQPDRGRPETPAGSA